MDFSSFTFVLKELSTQCGLIGSLLVIAVVWLSFKLTKSEAGREADRVDATRRLEAANATIIRIMEASTKVAENTAVAVGKMETVLTYQSRGSDD